MTDNGSRSTEPSPLGRYELITQLGEGGMARVFLAISRGPIGFNKLMVVKQIRPELAADQQFLGMFNEEARIALCLHHPNIVETFEIFEDEGRHLMAMEYLDGQTQADMLFRIGRDRMPIEEHVHILVQVLAALHHAHELRAPAPRGRGDELGLPLEIVHRDVSPSNVFVTYDGRVKLLDFGIAKSSGAAASQGGTRGIVTAKIGYGAPEVFMGQPHLIDRRADIFSVGVMLWEALAGCRRKIGENRSAMIEARISGREPSIRAVRPGVPAALAAICDRATSLRPEARPATAAEMGSALQGWLMGRSRAVGTRDLSALLNHHFAAEKAARRRSIERQLGGSDSDPTRNTPAAQVPAAARSPAPVVTAPGRSSSRSMPVSGSQMNATLDALVVATPPPIPWRRRAWVLAGSAGAAVGAAFAVVMLTGSTEQPPAAGGVNLERPVSAARPASPSEAARPPAPLPLAPPASSPAGPSAGGDPARDRASLRPPARKREAPALASAGPEGARPQALEPAPVPTEPTAAPAPERARVVLPGEQLPRPVRGKRPRRQLDEEDPYR